MKMDLGALQELPERREGVRIQEGDEIPITEVVGVTEDPHQDKHDHMENQELPEQTRGQECLPLRRQAPVRFEVCQTQFSRAVLVLGYSASSQKQRRSLERGRFRKSRIPAGDTERQELYEAIRTSGRGGFPAATGLRGTVRSER